jgi:hypothetical protein
MLAAPGDTQVYPGDRGFVITSSCNPGASRSACNLADTADDAKHFIATIEIECVVIMRFFQAVIIDYGLGFTVQCRYPD